MTDVVAIEYVRVLAFRVKSFFEEVCNGRLSRTGKAGEPETARLLVFDPGSSRLRDVQLLPAQINGAPKRESDQSGADGFVGELIDHDEAAEPLVFTVGRKRHNAIEAHVH